MASNQKILIGRFIFRLKASRVIILWCIVKSIFSLIIMGVKVLLGIYEYEEN